MRLMVVDLKLGLIFGLMISVLITSKASVADDDGYKKCERTVKKWASLSLDSEVVDDDKHSLRDLLFFLHVPRTGGRSYFHCFLKKLYSKSQECPRSYDKLRFDPRTSNCQLLSTHDDFSMMSRLPKENTSVITLLRNPIDRVFSAYEFSVEVAARFLVHPNLTSVARLTKRVRGKTSAVSTLDIWPWKYLVPWMREDLFSRRDARRLGGQSQLVTDSPYEMEDMLMPLHEYINEPITRDLVHNGATFQIAGLTNNSYLEEAHEIRHCVIKYQMLGEYVLEVAKKRLDGMLYVGLTDQHKESASVFAKIVGAQVISQHSISTSSPYAEINNVSERSTLLPDAHSDDHEQDSKVEASSNSEDEAANENLTTEKLIEAYETCILSLRSTQAERRVKSFKQISPANFTKEARLVVPEELIHEIASLNSLDMDLYKYAQKIFKQQQEHITTDTLYIKQTTAIDTSRYLNSYGSHTLRFMCLAMMSFFSLFICFFVNMRRRASKVKL